MRSSSSSSGRSEKLDAPQVVELAAQAIRRCLRFGGARRQATAPLPQRRFLGLGGADFAAHVIQAPPRLVGSGRCLAKDAFARLDSLAQGRPLLA